MKPMCVWIKIPVARMNYLQMNMCTQCPNLLGTWCGLLLLHDMFSTIFIQCVDHCHCTVSFLLSQYSACAIVTVQHVVHCHSTAYGPLSLYSMLFIVTIQCVVQCDCIGYSVLCMCYCHCLVCIDVNQIMPS